jgi:hypothetical protein
MSRNRTFHGAHVIDEFDPITEATLADEDTHVEPADFDDVRLAEHHGVTAGGFFAFENEPVREEWMGEW